MSRHYRCDICGEEMSSPASSICERPVIRGERSQKIVTVAIAVARGEDADLCSLCYRDAALRVLGVEPPARLAASRPSDQEVK